MAWSDLVEEYTHKLQGLALKQANLTTGVVEKIYRLIDLTSLNTSDTQEDIAFLCEKAVSKLGHVAGVCVYPQYVNIVAAQFEQTTIKPVTVANFPHGDNTIEQVLIEIDLGLRGGAKEIDIVFPYKKYLDGARDSASEFIASCKAACGDNIVLKIILETGALKEVELIADACERAFVAGADFVKTSTGKISEGASYAAAIIIFLIIKNKQLRLHKTLGCKISGGIREPLQALRYIALADEIMGQSWVNEKTFRIGGSHLVDNLLRIAELDVVR